MGIIKRHACKGCQVQCPPVSGIVKGTVPPDFLRFFLLCNLPQCLWQGPCLWKSCFCWILINQRQMQILHTHIGRSWKLGDHMSISPQITLQNCIFLLQKTYFCKRECSVDVRWEVSTSWKAKFTPLPIECHSKLSSHQHIAVLYFSVIWVSYIREII